MFKHFLIAIDGSPASRKAQNRNRFGTKDASAQRSLLITRSKSCTRFMPNATHPDNRTATILTSMRVPSKRIDEIGKMAKAADVSFVSLMASILRPRSE